MAMACEKKPLNKTADGDIADYISHRDDDVADDENDNCRNCITTNTWK